MTIPKQTHYQLLKNLQQSLISIASELKQVKSLQRSEQHLAVIQNSGRIEGLAQGLDFFIESFNPQTEQSNSTISFNY